MSLTALMDTSLGPTSLRACGKRQPGLARRVVGGVGSVLYEATPKPQITGAAHAVGGPIILVVRVWLLSMPAESCHLVE